MARLSRYDLPGYSQHVIQRGNNRQAIFADGEDQACFLELPRGGAGKCDCDIHARHQSNLTPLICVGNRQVQSVRNISARMDPPEWRGFMPILSALSFIARKS